MIKIILSFFLFFWGALVSGQTPTPTKHTVNRELTREERQRLVEELTKMQPSLDTLQRMGTPAAGLDRDLEKLDQQLRTIQDQAEAACKNEPGCIDNHK